MTKENESNCLGGRGLRCVKGSLSDHPSCQLFSKKLRRVTRALKAERSWKETESLSHFLSVLLKTFSLFLSISNLQVFLLSSILPPAFVDLTTLLSGLSAFLSLGPAVLWHNPLISVTFLSFLLQVTFF